MIPTRDRLILCALAVALIGGPLTAAEVPGELTCCRKSCYDPCEPVGPIRRLWRTLFRKPCPPAVVAVPVVPAAPPCPPSVRFGPPLSVPPAPPAPFTGSSSRPPRLTPPTPPPPVRLDRLASRTGEAAPVVRGYAPETGIEVTLINAAQPGRRVRVTTDRDGFVPRKLEPGEWLVYTEGDDGRLHYRGKVMAREGQLVRVNLGAKVSQ